jgi:hypothetical protein
MTKPSSAQREQVRSPIGPIGARARLALAVAGLVSTSACYTYAEVPIQAPMVEQRAEFRISDEGRVQLRDALGAGAAVLEGRIVNQDANGYSVRVYRLTNIRGESSAWTGEEVRVPFTAVESVARRDLDRGRSLIAVAAVAAAVTLFVLSRSLFGGGVETIPGVPPDGQSIR